MWMQNHFIRMDGIPQILSWLSIISIKRDVISMVTDKNNLYGLMLRLIVVLILLAQQAIAGPKTTGLDDEEGDRKPQSKPGHPSGSNRNQPPPSLFNSADQPLFPLVPFFPGLNSRAISPGPTPGVPVAAGFRGDSDSSDSDNDFEELIRDLVSEFEESMYLAPEPVYGMFPTEIVSLSEEIESLPEDEELDGLIEDFVELGFSIALEFDDLMRDMVIPEPWLVPPSVTVSPLSNVELVTSPTNIVSEFQRLLGISPFSDANGIWLGSLFWQLGQTSTRGDVFNGQPVPLPPVQPASRLIREQRRWWMSYFYRKVNPRIRRR